MKHLNEGLININKNYKLDKEKDFAELELGDIIYSATYSEDGLECKISKIIKIKNGNHFFFETEEGEIGSVLMQHNGYNDIVIEGKYTTNQSKFALKQEDCRYYWFYATSFKELNKMTMKHLNKIVKL